MPPWWRIVERKREPNELSTFYSFLSIDPSSPRYELLRRWQEPLQHRLHIVTSVALSMFCMDLPPHPPAPLLHNSLLRAVSSHIDGLPALLGEAESIGQLDSNAACSVQYLIIILSIALSKQLIWDLTVDRFRTFIWMQYPWENSWLSYTGYRQVFLSWTCSLRLGITNSFCWLSVHEFLMRFTVNTWLYISVSSRSLSLFFHEVQTNAQTVTNSKINRRHDPKTYCAISLCSIISS